MGLTRAQYRMLGRTVRGERLPVRRYRRTLLTVAALERQAFWMVIDGFWFPTDVGRKAHAEHGKRAS
jgi:hypothetical protein